MKNFFFIVLCATSFIFAGREVINSTNYKKVLSDLRARREQIRTQLNFDAQDEHELEEDIIELSEYEKQLWFCEFTKIWDEWHKNKNTLHGLTRSDPKMKAVYRKLAQDLHNDQKKYDEEIRRNA